MKKALILIATCCALAVPAAAVGSTPTQAASASCKSQLTASGAANFDKLYGSLGGCITWNKRLTVQQRHALLSAEKQCRAEQTASVAAFNTKYGTNDKSGKSGKSSTTGFQSNAFGKCVSSKAPAST